MRKVAVLMVLVLTLGLFAGCGGGSGSGVAGTYELVSMKADGMTMSKDDLESMAKMMNLEGSLVTLELSSDGKAVIASDFMEDMAGEGTYTVDGSKITVTINDAPATGTVDGSKITIGADDVEMVFEKK